jgi:D-3-phosphoglycerate dehydrogenase
MAGPAFRVAISGDFRGPDGAPTFPDFDLGPLQRAPGVETAFLESRNPVTGDQLEAFDALILLAHRFDAGSVPRSGRLAVVARFGVGYDSVDVDACTRAGIALVITPDGVRRPVAVSILTLMLALTGKLMVKDRLTRQAADGFARRAAHMGAGLVGRTFASLGIGNIGAETFRLLKPFDMRLIAHDPFADSALAAGLGVELVGIEEAFRQADVLSVSCPLTLETRHLVNAERIALMKPTAYLINTARGPIVDQTALTAALQAGRIAGAGLDVLEQEPPAADDPILALDNVILTPHALCWTDQCFAGIGAADVRAVLDVRQGRKPRGVVNREVLETPRWRARLAAFAAAAGRETDEDPPATRAAEPGRSQTR